MEETEARLSQFVLENGGSKALKNSKTNNEQATTTTETVATSSSLTLAKKNTGTTDKDNEMISANDNEPDLITSSILVNTPQQSSNGNVFDLSETVHNKTNNNEPENGKDNNDLLDTPTMPSANPKLIFIERLMDLNFQPPTGLSSFLGSGIVDDSNGSDNNDNNKPNKTDDNKFNDKDTNKDIDSSWSYVLLFLFHIFIVEFNLNLNYYYQKHFG